MESVDKTVEHLGLAAGKVGNHTNVADDIDLVVSKIDCLCHWQFVNSFPMILNCLHGVIVSEIGHPEKLYSLLSGEIHWLTCSVNNSSGQEL